MLKISKLSSVGSLRDTLEIDVFLGIAHCTVSKILKAFTDELYRSESNQPTTSNSVPVPALPRNRRKNPMRTPDTSANYVLVRDCVRKSRQRKLRVTVTQILDFLVAEKVEQIEPSDDDAVIKRRRLTSFRATQR